MSAFIYPTGIGIINKSSIKNFMTIKPPDGFEKFNAPLVHKVCEFYKKIYLFSFKISKRDRLGIYIKIENICLEIINLIVAASLEIKTNKFLLLNSARIKIEILKRLFRIVNELNIINNKQYIGFESDLQEISKMANGWIKYLK